MPGMLFSKSIRITDHISVSVPTVGEIYDDEDQYMDAVSAIIATPYDLMVQLDDAGIDFTQINDFYLFCLLFPKLQSMDTRLIFGDLDLTKFQPDVNSENGQWLLRDHETGAVIDRVIHDQICRALRKILSQTKNDKRPANEEARRYLIERERKKQKRRKNSARKSQLESLIVSLVNTAEFPYNYETVRDISIYQMYASLNQIAHKIRFDNVMVGYYAGTVKFEDISKSERTWISAE